MKQCQPLVLVMMLVAMTHFAGRAAGQHMVDIPAETIADKIRGGLLGQILGNLNGLPHEMKYLESPGAVESYTPSLPKGAWTDDDTDFEWVYVHTMQQENQLFLSAPRITQLWKERINRRIWCANQYARRLMDLGFQPPLTGDSVLNPWSEFNISGQFLCEAYGLMAPAMPQTAARIGLNYTQVAIGGEPAQTTQLFTTMIAVAFVTDDTEQILDRGQAAVDPRSRVYSVVADVRRWHREYPDNWRRTRALLKEKYARFDGTAMRDKNGYELNTGSIIGALLYGRGDLVETLRMAFNFGWDADCNAATAGTIAGVTKGYRWIMSQGWTIVDRYENRTRDGMPSDETITSYADRLVELAERVVISGGGERALINGRPVFRIVTERPANVQPLEDHHDRVAELRRKYREKIHDDLLHGASPVDRARAAYFAIALGLDGEFGRDHGDAWRRALRDLARQEPMMKVLFSARIPLAEPLQRRARNAGLVPP